MLGDLYLDAPTTTMMGGQPLVFINACESAALSGAFYDGFVPYFMAKGARGVVERSVALRPRLQPRGPSVSSKNSLTASR